MSSRRRTKLAEIVPLPGQTFERWSIQQCCLIKLSPAIALDVVDNTFFYLLPYHMDSRDHGRRSMDLTLFRKLVANYARSDVREQIIWAPEGSFLKRKGLISIS